MITIQVKGDHLIPDTIHAGTAGSYRESLMLEFSEEWNGLFCKIDFFPVRGKPVSVMWSENTKKTGIRIPQEVMQYSGLADFTVNGYWIEEGVVGEKRISLTGHIDVDATRRDVNPIPLKPTPNAYEQLRADMEKSIDRKLTEAKESGEFQGESGVYVGSGDPPNNENVQVDPDGVGYTFPYVTPEMFGALSEEDCGNDNKLITQTTQAIQRCFDYAVSTRTSIRFCSNYKINGTLELDKKSSYDKIPLSLDGGGFRLKTDVNSPLLKIRGDYICVQNLTLIYDKRFDHPDPKRETEKLDVYSGDWSEYDASMIVIESNIDNLAMFTDHLQMNNVRCVSSEETLFAHNKNSVGFEIVCNGDSKNKAHAYNLNFKSCMVERLGTALKITNNEFYDGSNGNSYDISSWGCKKYVDGLAEGSRFTGVVQASIVVEENNEAVNPYLIYNIGYDNVFDCRFYDTYDGSEIVRQKIMEVNDRRSVFGFLTSRKANDGSPLYVGTYSFEYGDVVLPYNPSKNADGVYNMVRNMPVRNSFADTNNVSIVCAYEKLSDAIGTWGGLHTTFDKNHMSKQLDVLFRDNPWGRKTSVFTCDPDSKMEFVVKFPEPVKVDALFVDFGNVYEGSRGTTILEASFTDSDGDLKTITGTVAEAKQHQIGFLSGVGLASEFTLRIRFNVGGTQPAYQMISQITGYAHNDSGLV